MPPLLGSLALRSKKPLSAGAFSLRVLFINKPWFIYTSPGSPAFMGQLEGGGCSAEESRVGLRLPTVAGDRKPQLRHLPGKQDPHLSGGREEPALDKPQLDEVTHQQLYSCPISAGRPTGLKGQEPPQGWLGEQRADGRARKMLAHSFSGAWAPLLVSWTLGELGKAGRNSWVLEPSPSHACLSPLWSSFMARRWMDVSDSPSLSPPTTSDSTQTSSATVGSSEDWTSSNHSQSPLHPAAHGNVLVSNPWDLLFHLRRGSYLHCNVPE